MGQFLKKKDKHDSVLSEVKGKEFQVLLNKEADRSLLHSPVHVQP